jgi:hypothetical protein
MADCCEDTSERDFRQQRHRRQILTGSNGHCRAIGGG